MSITFAWWLGLSKVNITSGFYSFNSLMVGLVMGIMFKFSLTFFLLLFIFSMLAVLITNAVGIFFSKYALPVLGIPFVITVWLLIFATRNLHGLQPSEHFLFVYNDLYSLGGMQMVKAYQWLQDFHLPGLLDVYFKSLGAIYFQYNIVAGILIALGLLIYSRIAFTLSVLGFVSGYYAFYFLNGDVSQLSYSYIGFNYILAAISIGGFYLIPSSKTYLLAALICAIIAVVHSAIGYFLGLLQLPMYSLPSSIIILLTLLTLKYRYQSKGLTLVPLQLFSPEKNLYRHLHQRERYKNDTFTQINLPFIGDWYVSQAHDGKITHKCDWRHAWDFVVTDEMKKTFRLPGKELTDFFCYNIPITSPAAGYVTHINDDVEDNLIGEVNTQENWGNTIIVRHAEGLYSKISHIKQGSFKVKVGDYVYEGTQLASCGNSGRSPEPHIHFQLQSTPFVGSKTLKYPLSYYVVKRENDVEFHSFDYPLEQSTVSNISKSTLLLKAFGFIPGEEIKMEVETNGKKEIIVWDVYTDAYNSSYLHCKKTNSYAYFVNNYTVFYFTEFYGNKNSLLHYFFLSANKILLGYYDQLKINESLPANSFYSGIPLMAQDFVAPFIRFVKAEYETTFSEIDDLNMPDKIVMKSEARVKLFGNTTREIKTTLTVSKKKIQSFTIEDGNKKITATCLND